MIKQSDRLPAGSLKKMGANGPEDVDIKSLCKGKRIVFFAVPGAFTPTCSAQHLPGFVEHHDAIKAAGVDEIVCFAVNDFFVMDAWGKQQNTGDKVMMLADGSATYTQSLGLALDLTAVGLGMRCQRFAMIVDDGVISHLAIEEDRAFKVSSAEAILAVLKN